MKRKLIILLAITTITTMSLIGCGNKKEVGTNENTTVQTEAVKTAKKPEKIIEQFAKKVFAWELEDALNMIEMPEGSVKDVKAFENYLIKSDIEQEDIKKIDTEVIGTDDLRKVNVTATTKDGKEIETSFCAMLNSDNNWVVSPNGMISEDWVINVPKGSTVKLNGTALSVEAEDLVENAGENNETVYDSYKIPMIINGNYSLEVEHPYAESSIEEKVYPGTKKTVEMELNKETLEKAEKAFDNLLSVVENNATQNQDFGSLVGTVVSENSKSLASIQESYNLLKEMLNTNYKTYNYHNYKDLTHSNIAITKSYYVGENKVYLEGTYTNLYKDRYAGEIKRLENAPFDNKSKSYDFKIIFEVDDNGNFLHYKGERVFTRID